MYHVMTRHSRWSVATRFKKAVLSCLLLHCLYMAVGLGLVASGTVNKLYLGPGWSVKGPRSKRDTSGFAADGPLVFYQDQQLISKQIAPRANSLVLLTDTLATEPQPTVTCVVPETQREFRVPLRGAATVPADTYLAPEKLLAISDVEGNFLGFEQLLREAGVVDAQLRWQFGRGHLVLVGDFFDRGLNVTECLWLIYKLEHEAEQAGGQVHFIMGNHERMNLTGHYKYVRRKYRVNADTLGVPYPRWYDRTTVLGRWLRTKNVIEKIGPTLFVHGGISPEVAALGFSLTHLNDLARTSLYASSLSTVNKQVTQPPSSPDWYRGLVQKAPTEAQVAQVLATYAATRLVVGHTPVEHISAFYHGKVIAIDMPHQQRTDAGQPLQALWLAGNTLRIVDSHGNQETLPAK